MGDYGENERSMPTTDRHFQWPLLIGALLTLAVIYAVMPTADSGPNSVTVVGISAPRPAFGSYPGLRVPLTPRPGKNLAQYRT